MYSHRDSKIINLPVRLFYGKQFTASYSSNEAAYVCIIMASHGRHGVFNLRKGNDLFSNLFRLTTKKISRLYITGLLWEAFTSDLYPCYGVILWYGAIPFTNMWPIAYFMCHIYYRVKWTTNTPPTTPPLPRTRYRLPIMSSRSVLCACRCVIPCHERLCYNEVLLWWYISIGLVGVILFTVSN